ncbi:hypothetical protein D3C85_1516510 [compost metagenome]
MELTYCSQWFTSGNSILKTENAFHQVFCCPSDGDRDCQSSDHDAHGIITKCLLEFVTGNLNQGKVFALFTPHFPATHSTTFDGMRIVNTPMLHYNNKAFCFTVMTHGIRHARANTFSLKFESFEPNACNRIPIKPELCVNRNRHNDSPFSMP